VTIIGKLSGHKIGPAQANGAAAPRQALMAEYAAIRA
jgi:hypothetical protein